MVDIIFPLQVIDFGSSLIYTPHRPVCDCGLKAPNPWSYQMRSSGSAKPLTSNSLRGFDFVGGVSKETKRTSTLSCLPFQMSSAMFSSYEDGGWELAIS